MLGYIKTDGINPTHTNTDLHDVTQAYFVQDDWKVNSGSNAESRPALGLFRTLYTIRR